MNTARELTSRLAELLHHEHTAMADFLVALANFHRKRRWEELGYASLFSFLRRELRLSAGAAQYRKTAAELVQEYPEVEAALRAGDLCLSSVNELAKVLTPDNATEVLPRFFGLSSRDAAFVAASIRPVENPPRREFIVTTVRLDTAAASTTLDGNPPSPPPETSLLRAPELNAPARVVPTSAPPPATRSAPVPPPITVEPLDAEHARVHMTVSRRLLEKLEAARDALSHSHPGAGRDEIIEAGLDLLLERTAKRRGLVKNPRKKAPQPKPPVPASTSDAPVDVAPVTPTPPPPGTRRPKIPAAIRRAIWERDQGKCQWPVDGGGICGSTHRLELDHVFAFAKGGRITSADDGRILCDPHNDLHAREVFGDAWMDRFTRRRPSRR